GSAKATDTPGVTPKGRFPKEIGGVDDQRGTIPVAARIPQPLVDGRWEMGAPVEGDNPNAGAHLVMNRHVARALDQLNIVVVSRWIHGGSGVEPQDTAHAHRYVLEPVPWPRHVIVNATPRLC